LRIALDATYSIGRELTGVGAYSKEILCSLTAAHPEVEFLLCYRPHRFLRSLLTPRSPNSLRAVLWETRPPRKVQLFHGLNQRLPEARLPKAVSTFHDLFVLTGDYSSVEFRRRFAAQARHAAERSDLIIAVSRFTASQVEELLGVEKDRVRVIPHGVRLPQTTPQEARERMILHVGAVQRRKNIQRLVRAFGQVPSGWRLVLAGSFGFGAEDTLREVEKSPRRGDIELLGYVPAQKLADLYSRASIFAFPSLDEGFGMPVLEAMAWGIPVVASNRSSLPEVCGDAALLVDPFDVDAIASALRTLAGDDVLRASLIERGLAHTTGFSWQLTAERTWKVYQELLA
jgi:alpha-1,3-rhamnosyl/mannosyltransferase